MSPEYVRLNPSMTIGQALARVRAVGSAAETIQLLPVTDDVRRLVGMVSLADLVLAPESAPISTVTAAPVSRTAEDRAEEVARACTGHRLLALPITDREERLVGILTVDDALKIISEAEDEDAARAGAAEPLRQPYLSTSIFRIVRTRTGWLLILAFSAMLTVSVLEQFEATLTQAVVLALFIPLLTGIGGNTGSQAASTLTRALAVADVRPKDIGKVALREVRVGLTMGLLLAVLGFAIATPIYGADIGIVISCTLLLVCTMAATVGGIMPLAAKALRVDPAAFSTPFISTFCDATGLLIYFGIAKLVLGL
jgi:magnesium transporter